MAKKRNFSKWFSQRNRKRIRGHRPKLPKQFYYALKDTVGTEEFAQKVSELGGVRAAIKNTDWYQEVSRHSNFAKARCYNTWVKRMCKNWQSQQTKRAQAEYKKSKPVRVTLETKPKRIKKSRKNSPKNRLERLRKLLYNTQAYVVSTDSLSPAMHHQKLLMAYDLAYGRERERLAREISSFQSTVRAKVFVGDVKDHSFNSKRQKFSWNTNFLGVVLEVEFSAQGFKSAWKARILYQGNCNQVKGWWKHNIHRRSRLPVRFLSLVTARIKQSRKTHWIRDLDLTKYNYKVA